METIEKNEEQIALEGLYNEALANGTLDQQRDSLAELAQEHDTSVQALEQAKADRDREAAERIAEMMKKDPAATDGNASDYWTQPKE